MRGGHLLSRLLMAVTLVVAVLTFAPPGAQAHAGHSHGVHQATYAAKPVIEPTAVARVLEIAPSAGQDELTIGPNSGESGSLLTIHGSKTPQSCPGGCCHSPGTGCCAAWFSAPLEIVVPPLGRSPFDAAVIGGAGITPGALPEPPKSLV
jgi:hypothetical protein